MLGLTLRWMFETAICDCAQKFWLQEEIAETCRMYADIATLFVGVPTRYGEVAFLCRAAVSCYGGSIGFIRLKLLVRVINEVFLVRHLGRIRVSWVWLEMCC